MHIVRGSSKGRWVVQTRLAFLLLGGKKKVREVVELSVSSLHRFASFWPQKDTQTVCGGAHPSMISYEGLSMTTLSPPAPLTPPPTHT